MKSIKSKICIALSVVLMLTMSGTGVFASEVAAPAEQPAAETATAAAASATATKVAAPAKVAGLKAISGFKSVKLTWDASKGATYYIVERAKSGGKFAKIGKKVTKTTFEDKKAKMYTKYTYRVTAVNAGGKSAPTKLSTKCVRKMRIYITTKVNKHLKAHDGSGKTCTIKAGTRLATDGFGGGCFYFTRKGATFRISGIATRNEKAQWLRPNKSRDNDYTEEDANYFINKYVKKKHIKSSKKYLIWVSTYTQHLYVFKKSKGQWKLNRDWDVSTGKATSPSPTGNKSIHKKIGSRHGLPCWNCFSSMNALHGCFASWEHLLGNPASGGCIRNKNKNARWIYNNCPKGTKVIVY